MKVCRECGQSITEENDAYNPAGDLGEIFLPNTDATDVCPECQEEFGIISLLGFDE
jgi:hypothetical protein